MTAKIVDGRKIAENIRKKTAEPRKCPGYGGKVA